MLFQLNVLTKFFTSKLFLCLPKVGHMIKSCKEPIRKQISPLRNLSSWWISFEKSNSDFMDFLFTIQLGNPKNDLQNYSHEKWSSFCYLCECVQDHCSEELFFKSFFQISKRKGKKGNPRTDISELKTVCGFCV